MTITKTINTVVTHKDHKLILVTPTDLSNSHHMYLYSKHSEYHNNKLFPRGFKSNYKDQLFANFLK